MLSRIGWLSNITVYRNIGNWETAFFLDKSILFFVGYRSKEGWFGCFTCNLSLKNIDIGDIFSSVKKPRNFCPLVIYLVVYSNQFLFAIVWFVCEVYVFSSLNWQIKKKIIPIHLRSTSSDNFSCDKLRNRREKRLARARFVPCAFRYCMWGKWKRTSNDIMNIIFSVRLFCQILFNPMHIEAP